MNVVDLSFIFLSYPIAASSKDDSALISNYYKSFSLVYRSSHDFLFRHNIGSQIASQFDWYIYKSLNKDLSHMTPYMLVLHYFTHGLYEPRYIASGYSLIDRSLCLQKLDGISNYIEMPIYAVVHCYYFDILQALLPYLRLLSRLGATIRIYVNNVAIADHEISHYVDSISSLNSNVTWCRVPNLYDDWPTFFQAYNEGIFDNPGITYKIQTKKSHHLGIDGGRLWLDELLQPITGTYGSVFTVANYIKDGHDMVGSLLHKRYGLGFNPSPLLSLCSALGIDSASLHKLPFVGGAIFAVSNSMAKSFYSNLPYIDYTATFSNSTPYCGRYIGHALERLICYWSHFHSPKSISWLY